MFLNTAYTNQEAMRGYQKNLVKGEKKRGGKRQREKGRDTGKDRDTERERKGETLGKTEIDR